MVSLFIITLLYIYIAMNSVLNIFEGTSPSVSDVDHYIIITKSLNSICLNRNSHSKDPAEHTGFLLCKLVYSQRFFR
jgi:hypothetical protein